MHREDMDWQAELIDTRRKKWEAAILRSCFDAWRLKTKAERYVTTLKSW